MISARRVEEIRTEASYHRDRFDLYKAKLHGPRPTSTVRLRELERRHLGAASRLRAAELEHSGEAAPSRPSPTKA